MDSHFQQHLGMNYIPSPSEIRNISDYLKVAVEEACEIDAEIEQLEQRLHVLQEKQSKVYNVIEQHRALISPARRLDRDALEAIFLACLPDDRNPCMSATEAPVLLTCICSSWRTIAHSIPRLWAAIHIALPIGGVPLHVFQEAEDTTLSFEKIRLKIDQRQVAAKEWLNRSGICPLSISVYGGYDTSTDFYPPIVQLSENRVLAENVQQLHISFITTTLLPHSQHWSEVDVCLSLDVLTGMLKNRLTAQCMPMLRKLHIATQGTHRHIQQPDMLNQPSLELKDIFGLLSSQLISATMQGITLKSSDMSVIPLFKWEQVTELNIDPFHDHIQNSPVASEVLLTDIIRHCPSLKTLKLNLFGLLEGASSDLSHMAHNVEPIMLPHLTTLSLMGLISLRTLTFVKSLHLLSLKKLDLIFHGTRPYSVPTSSFNETLSSLLRGCGDNVQSLGLYPTTDPPFSTISDMVKILQLMPNLIRLRFFSAYSHSRWGPWYRNSTSIPYLNAKHIINDGLLDALSPLGREYADIICPHLEELDCNPGTITGISASALKEFVKARMHAHFIDPGCVAALRKLRVSVGEIRQEDSNEERITLDDQSAIYFIKPQDIKFSPWEGLNPGDEQSEVPIYREAYTDL